MEGFPQWTVGVEIECLLISPNTPEWSHGSNVVWQALAKQPYLVRCPHEYCDATHEYTLPVLDNGSLDREIRDTFWSVDNDSSVKLESHEVSKLPNNYRFTSIEIRSRKLDHDNINVPLGCSGIHMSPIEHIPWQQELQLVLERLENAFNRPGNPHGTRLIVNRTCGLHVHVGRDHRGFDLATYRNLTSVYTCFERVIDNAMDINRIGGYKGPLGEAARHRGQLSVQSQPHGDDIDFFVQGFIRPQSTVHIEDALRAYRKDLDDSRSSRTANPASLDDEIELARRRLDVLSWIKVLQDANQKDHIRNIYLRSESGFALNVASLWDSTARPTVEFRQHGGSLDLNEICAWMDFVVCMTKWCHDFDAIEVLRLTYNHCFDLDYAFLELARLFGVSDYTRSYYTAKGLASRLDAADRAAILQRNHIPVELTEFMRLVEVNRLDAWDPEKVAARIRVKVAECAYGRMPRAFLETYMGVEFANSEAGRQMTLDGPAVAQDDAALASDLGGLSIKQDEDVDVDMED